MQAEHALQLVKLEANNKCKRTYQLQRYAFSCLNPAKTKRAASKDGSSVYLIRSLADWVLGDTNANVLHLDAAKGA